jgi:hypothetical protein
MKISNSPEARPQVKKLSPLEAAGKLYTIHQITSQPTTSFQVNTF